MLYLVLEKAGRAATPLALLRAAAWGTVGVLLVNPSCHRAGIARTDVLLDASLSMTDADSAPRWRAALDTARAAAGSNGRILLFGEEPELYREGAAPAAQATRLLPALREAAARGSRVVIVTDGVIDDAGSLPHDLLRGARVVIVPRPDRPDAGIAVLLLPAALRAGDTATARIDIAAAGTSTADTVTLELLEQDRVVARTRVPLGTGGNLTRELSFVPTANSQQPTANSRQYTARLVRFATDAEPRNDARRTAAAVSAASAVALFSDSPDWDFRWLARTLSASSGVPVKAFVRLGAAGWRDARTMATVPEALVRAEAGSAALVVAHGSTEGVEAIGRLARRGLWKWTTAPRLADASANGDWYIAAPEFSSPVGGALAGVPMESLPPLDMVLDERGDSVSWTGLVAQLDRRGRSRPVVQGAIQGNRRTVSMGMSGLWRWASRGGVAAEGYRALVASLTDWLLEHRPGTPGSLSALRDSLARGASELLPRAPTLRAQAGTGVALAGEPEPLRFSLWLYVTALVALVLEWVLRRRRGLR